MSNYYTWQNDTIAAQATPPGRGGVGIIRVSGKEAPVIARALLGEIPAPRQAIYTVFRDAVGEVIDNGLVIYFAAPHSFTGEDVLELQTHGSPIVLDLLLQRLVELGCRLAEAGEFSLRAFLNGKIDLTQAEATADLINAVSVEAAKAASHSLQGEFSRHVHFLKEQLIKIRLQVEAAIDFTEEELDLKSTAQLAQDLVLLLSSLRDLLVAAKQGVILQEGLTVVLAGAPNVGKSSLLNALTGEDTAIVTPVPGTTRDILRATINLGGLPLKVLDTAGLQLSTDLVEQEGVCRAGKAILEADHILLLIDVTQEKERDVIKLHADFLINFEHFLKEIGLPFTAADETVLTNKKFTIIFNKIDLTQEMPCLKKAATVSAVYISAKNKIGLNLLREHLQGAVGYNSNAAIGFSARRRHLLALEEAENFLIAAQNKITQQENFELLAEELRLAQKSFDTVTGEFSSEDLLQRIFSEFCVGK